MDWNVYVEIEQARNLLTGKGDKSRRQLIFHAVMKPDIYQQFGDVLIMSADIHRAPMRNIWTDVDFVTDDRLDKHLRYTVHPGGPRLTIKHLFDRPWSKRFRDTVLSDGRTVQQVAAAAAMMEMEGRGEFVWTANADIESDPFAPPPDYTPTAERIPFVAHGMNCWQHINNAVLMPANNPTPAAFRFLDWLGLPGEVVRNAIQTSTIGQQGARTSIRNLDWHEAVTWVVMDRDTALALAADYPGCRVEKSGYVTEVLAGVEIPEPREGGRPRIHETNAAEISKRRGAERARLMASIEALKGGDVKHSIYSGSPSPLSTSITIYDSLHSVTPFSAVNVNDFNELSEFLRDWWSASDLTKATNAHFVPSEMDPAGRGAANVRHAKVMVLDNDSGDLSREDFSQLFPGIRMTIVNTSSSTAAKPRWRAYIPLTHAVDAEIYTALLNRLFKRLAKMGFIAKANASGKPVHGFDRKMSAANLFGMPMRAADPDPAASFFDDVPGQPLDVLGWLESITRSMPVMQAGPAPRTHSEREAEEREYESMSVDIVVRELAAEGIPQVDTDQYWSISGLRYEILFGERPLSVGRMSLGDIIAAVGPHAAIVSARVGGPTDLRDLAEYLMSREGVAA
ncbi:hypothetical protein [Falsiroseomonas sp.]|uniref:hypothetical protein n=1 Tax=Falsiroseomonas sp. TaxID=2870721 RepID=UPI002736E5A6|nr:hypothetical protein [Falsiroseomonas sp.]MDP3414496.1 hypothetical protein [Falsiroseomonas sp.]